MKLSKSKKTKLINVQADQFDIHNSNLEEELAKKAVQQYNSNDIKGSEDSLRMMDIAS